MFLIFSALNVGSDLKQVKLVACKKKNRFVWDTVETKKQQQRRQTNINLAKYVSFIDKPTDFSSRNRSAYNTCVCDDRGNRRWPALVLTSELIRTETRDNNARIWFRRKKQPPAMYLSPRRFLSSHSRLFITGVVSFSGYDSIALISDVCCWFQTCHLVSKQITGSCAQTCTPRS